MTTIEKILIRAKPRERRRILSHMHDVLYAKAVSLISKNNYCQVEKCGACLTCLDGRTYKQESFCCSGCKYLDEKKGCTVEALSCRAWYCNTVRVNTSQFTLGKLQNVQDEIHAWHLDTFRGSKKDAIESALIRIDILKNGKPVGYWSFGSFGMRHNKDRRKNSDLT